VNEWLPALAMNRFRLVTLHLSPSQPPAPSPTTHPVESSTSQVNSELSTFEASDSTDTIMETDPKMGTEDSAPKHFNDWPNDQGVSNRSGVPLFSY
jgi:hypothetical protein